ncbi:MAG: class I SAM-dependent methyltransferase [Acidimicrobiales bacterium]
MRSGYRCRVGTTGDSGQYFTASPDVASAPQTVELVLPDLFLTLTTDRGVFSGSRIDAGTRFLLRDHPSIGTDVANILDLGCGYGPIALASARRAPQARIWGVDVNDRAIDLARANAASASVENVWFGRPEEVPADLRFDLLLSNPPIRIGKTALHELLTTWLDRLAPSGRACMVVQKHLGSDSLAAWLTAHGWETRRLASRAGYRLLETKARP